LYPELNHFIWNLKLLTTLVVHLSADTLTPVGLYLRLRDAFPQSLLLECSDFSSREDAYSYICLNPVSGIEITTREVRQYSPGKYPVSRPLSKNEDIVSLTDSFVRSIPVNNVPEENIFPGLFGFTTFEAVNLFDNVNIRKHDHTSPVPLLKYDLYSVVIAINHFNNTMTICEMENDPENKLTDRITSLLANKNTTTFPFMTVGPGNYRLW
jgi:anthranilate synthase component I